MSADYPAAFLVGLLLYAPLWLHFPEENAKGRLVIAGATLMSGLVVLGFFAAARAVSP